MKQIKNYILLIISCLMLTSCPGNNEPEPPVYQKYEDTCSLPVNGGEITYSVSKYMKESFTVSSTPSWLKVTTKYENLSIIISAQPNTAKDERKCTLTVKDNGNALTLHVIQAAAANDNTEPGYNNSTSTKPALSPIK